MLYYSALNNLLRTVQAVFNIKINAFTINRHLKFSGTQNFVFKFSGPPYKLIAYTFRKSAFIVKRVLSLQMFRFGTIVKLPTLKMMDYLYYRYCVREYGLY